jgi:hypothetical protein
MEEINKILSTINEDHVLVKDMQKDIYQTLNILIENQKIKSLNDETVINNQKNIIRNQEVIVNNQVSIIRNQKHIVQNQITLEVILTVQEEILSKLKNEPQEETKKHIALLKEKMSEHIDIQRLSDPNLL